MPYQSDWDTPVDKIIRQAMDEGEFENLPGQGRPLDLGPEEEDDTWAANRILKNSGYSADWIEDRKDIERLTEQARTRLIRTWRWSESALAQGESISLIHEEWDRAKSLFRRAVNKINDHIRTYNLKTPPNLNQLQLRILDAEREIHALMETRQRER